MQVPPSDIPLRAASPPASLSAPCLPLTRYRLRYVRRGPGGLPPFTGSAWRGALGHALLQLAGPEEYQEIFETPVPKGAAKMRAYRDAPHPFSLTVVPPAETLLLTLFGHGNRHAPLLARALAAAGETGLGAAATRLVLEEAAAETAPGSGIWQPWDGRQAVTPRVAAWPRCPRRVRIELRTPLRIRRQEHYVRPRAFVFADLFGALLRRISLLTAFYAPVPLETDFRGLSQRSQAVAVEHAELEWWSWERFSSRQERLIDMSGLGGCFEVVLEGFEELWPYLWLGQLTQAGKGTAMGLGSYEVRTP